MNILYWTSFAAILIPTLLALGWLFFRTWNDFVEALWFNLMPDLISLLRGQLNREWMAELKLGIFVILGLIAAMYEKQLLDKIFQQFTH